MIDFLPLGSVVKVKDSDKRLLIIGRGMKLYQDGSETIYDYGAVPYPEGIIGDQECFINHSDIVEIVFKGYEDQDNEEYVKILVAAYEGLER